MVYRVYVEKKQSVANEAEKLLNDLVSLVQIKNLTNLRILNRYDVENIKEELFNYSIKTVFSEPQLDKVTFEPECNDCSFVFAVEYLPGQFDQRADSAAQCIQIISQGERPVVRTAKVYMLFGKLTKSDLSKIKKYVINPVECREASLDKYSTLKVDYPEPPAVKTIKDFCDFDHSDLENFLNEYGLAMDFDDIKFCQGYFKSEKRNPTVTEIKVIDTYWSDHCRHTTFLTTIDNVIFEDDLLQSAYHQYLETREQLNSQKPINLMDIATIAAKSLIKNNKLENLDQSDEINACTVKIKVDVQGELEDWLLLFKNETHNHPTEIEPFGGAATCIGGAIRDPLSGRAYVYAAMRVTGAANPLKDVKDTLPGKLPQRKIVTTAAQGYSSYGNQIGVATGQVDELYHEGYVAKRMEIGAVIGAVPAENVRRETPCEGDIVILLGGKTGRDGCGGATGSSKSHNLQSLESCGAEVQKGNAPEERKIQRLFRNKKASLLIKRCNDFGAGGVSVAIGELADGVKIDLNAVPKKYEGLNSTELAISESQERMAVVVDKGDAEQFIKLAQSENIEATKVAVITGDPRLVMSHNGNKVVDLTREFLNSNGAEKHITITPQKPESFEKTFSNSFENELINLAEDLNVCSKRGLSENFDSTIGAATVLMPFGGKNQLTPIQAMVHKIPVLGKETKTCSLMSWGFNPFISEKSPYHGAYLAVVESISKLIATGAEFKDIYLTFQEYFEKPNKDGKRWGKPLAALLGAFKAQAELEVGSVGGKDSMSGSFEEIDVPPTLVSFAVTTENINNIISPEFKKFGKKVVLLKPDYDNYGLPLTKSLKTVYNTVTNLIATGKVNAAFTPVYGGVAEAVMKMSFGNGIGIDLDDSLTLKDLFGYCYGSFVLELNTDEEIGTLIGVTSSKDNITYQGNQISLERLLNHYEDKLESIYPCNKSNQNNYNITKFGFNTEKQITSPVKFAKPRVLIPVFPGTNCEYDTAKALESAGCVPEIIVIKNLNSKDISQSVELISKKINESQIVFIPGGFSSGDEPDGSAKFITAFFRNAVIKESIHNLIKNRDGLMGGVCNGFQALIKLGLVPYGEIIDTTENCPTLTYNTIGLHRSKNVNIRVASNKSPWLANTTVGEIYTAPISHGEGRFFADEQLIIDLANNGQIATQYVDANGNPTSEINYNPNNSAFAVEGITSPDGRILGKMGHSERFGNGLYKNVPGIYDMGIFHSAIKYFK